MAERTSRKVRRYCEANGIKVPIGFDRHPAGRYVVIELTNPPKLVARTWFKQEDAIYYLNHLANPVPLQVLDFQESNVLSWDGGRRFKRVGKFEIP